MAPKTIVKLSTATSNNAPRPPKSRGKPNAKKQSNPQVQSSRRPKKPQPLPNRRCRFLEDLPGEIRNKIYEFAVGYVFVADQGFRFWTAGNTKKSQSRLPRDFPTCHWIVPSSVSQRLSGNLRERPLWPVDIPQSLDTELRFICEGKRYTTYPTKVLLYRSGSRYSSILGHEIRHVNVALLFVCRQIYKEVVSIVYSRATFAFGSQRSIRNKLLGSNPYPAAKFNLPQLPRKMVSIRPANLAFITSLSLECRAYGSPIETKNTCWQRRYYQSWTITCARIVVAVPALKDLRLFLVVPMEPPIRLVLADKWVTPFLQFSGCKALEVVQVRLLGSYRHFDSELLEVFAEVVRRKIIGWDDAAALEAITHAKESQLVSRGNKLLTGDLQFMEWSNGVGAARVA